MGYVRRQVRERMMSAGRTTPALTLEWLTLNWSENSWQLPPDNRAPAGLGHLHGWAIRGDD
jgi:hypothetical protein